MKMAEADRGLRCQLPERDGTKPAGRRAPGNRTLRPPVDGSKNRSDQDTFCLRIRCPAPAVLSVILPLLKIGRSNQAESYCSDEWAWPMWKPIIISDLNCTAEELGKGLYRESDPSTIILTNKPCAAIGHNLGGFAGLGSIGLNQMLITDKGCCGWLGSLVSIWN